MNSIIAVVSDGQALELALKSNTDTIFYLAPNRGKYSNDKWCFRFVYE